MNKIIHYDKRGNIIYYKDSNGNEYWKEYDENNNEIYYKDSNGFEEWREYDENNNLIHYKDSNGKEYWYEYDKNNNEIYSKNSDGFEKWYEYDENNNLIHYKDSDGYEYWKEYDENNNLIHYKNSNGFEEWYEYDKNNNLIHYKNFDRYESWREYDENNNLIHFKDSNEYEYWREYDKNNNCIHYKNSFGHEYWRKYDKNNNIINYKTFDKENVMAARLDDLDYEQKEHLISEFRGFKRLYTIDNHKIVSTDYALFEKNNGKIFKFPYSMISDCTYFYNNDDDLLLLDSNTDKPYMNIIFKINLPAIGIINNDFAIIKVSDIKKAIHYILDYTVINKIDNHINKISENENYTTYRLDTDSIEYNFIPKFAPVIEYDDNINNILSRFIERINNRDKILLPQNLKTDFIIVDRDLLEYIEKEMDIYNECYTFAINKLSTKGYIPKIYKIYTGKCIENRLLRELDFGIHTDKYLFTIPSFLSTILKRLK